MSAIEQLQRLVERDGYTKADVDALKLLAEAGWHPEKAAEIVLFAKTDGKDSVAMARKFIQLAQIVRGER